MTVRIDWSGDGRQKTSRGKQLERSAADFFPERLSLNSLRSAAENCRGCELYRRATQTIFGHGPAHAKLMLVGEVPGDQEDQQGEPFVGPAGRLLDESMKAAGIERGEVYLTNAVKHFKWELRGKRRLHAKPSSREIRACRPWLEAEIDVVHPQVLVCLGATAAQALLGSAFRFTKHLGQVVATPQVEKVIATFHPSSVLRAPEPADRTRMRKQLIHDLTLAMRNLN
jgi:DNA polymerase